MYTTFLNYSSLLFIFCILKFNEHVILAIAPCAT